MGAVTYPDQRVVDFIQGQVIPLQVHYNAQPLAATFNVKWTPTLVTLDSRGEEHHRTVGFLPAEELIPSLLLGIGKVHFDLDHYEKALHYLDRLLAEFPKSNAAAEAIYLRGVCRYKNTGEAGSLKEAYEQLQAQYPTSEWTTRSSPYRLL
jgi:tetratricopeptide (TPR) repeat protein